MRTLEVQPNPENTTPGELRVAMEASPAKRAYIRLNALRLLLRGTPRATVGQIFGRSDRRVRLWIELSNQGGIDALRTHKPGGRQRKVKFQRVRDLLLPVLENPAQTGAVHWTGIKLHGFLQEQLCVELGYRTTIRWLHELNFHLRFPRPWPERQNEQERQTFLERLRGWTNDPTVQLWFSDECGVEGDPRPRRRWVQPGKPCTVPYLGDHTTIIRTGRGRCLLGPLISIESPGPWCGLSDVTVPFSQATARKAARKAMWRTSIRRMWIGLTGRFATTTTNWLRRTATPSSHR